MKLLRLFGYAFAVVIVAALIVTLFRDADAGLGPAPAAGGGPGSDTTAIHTTDNPSDFGGNVASNMSRLYVGQIWGASLYGLGGDQLLNASDNTLRSSL